MVDVKMTESMDRSLHSIIQMLAPCDVCANSADPGVCAMCCHRHPSFFERKEDKR